MTSAQGSIAARMGTHMPRHQPKTLPVVFRHSTDDALKMAMIPMDCAERLSNGTAEDGDWDTVASRINIGTILARWFYKDEKPAMAEAAYIIAESRTLTPSQHYVIENALRLVNAMEAQTTRRDLAKAITYVFKNAHKD